MAVSLDHVVLEVHEVSASMTFYTQVLGLAPVRWDAYRNGEAPFASVRVSEDTIVDFFPPPMWRNPKRPDNPNHLCFTMSRREVAACTRRLKRGQVPIRRRAPRNFGARGYGRSLYIDDPDGVSIEVRYYPETLAAEDSAHD